MTVDTHPIEQASALIDLRSIPPYQRHALVFGSFDALARGQALQLVNDHNPQPLHHQFDARTPGQFDWTLLEAGPAVWRVQITRVRDAAQAAAQASGSCCSGGACCG